MIRFQRHENGAFSFYDADGTTQGDGCWLQYEASYKRAGVKWSAVRVLGKPCMEFEQDGFVKTMREAELHVGHTLMLAGLDVDPAGWL